MDPSIMKKLLEEDEDENMHSGAEVEAFTAALNKDIERDMPISTTSNSESGLSLGGCQNSFHAFHQWEYNSHDNTNQHNSINSQSQHEELQQQQQVPHSSETELDGAGNLQQKLEDNKELKCFPLETNGSHVEHRQHCEEAILSQPSQSNGRSDAHLESVKFEGPSYSSLVQESEQTSALFSSKIGLPDFRENHVLHEQNSGQNSGSESQTSKSQGMGSRPSTPQEQAINQMKVPFAAILPVIIPHLEKDKAMQLDTLHNKLKKNEIRKEGFARHIRHIVGDHILRLAVVQHANQSQVLARKQHLQVSSGGTQNLKDLHSFAQKDQKGHKSSLDPFEMPFPIVHRPSSSSFCANGEGKAKELLEMERQSDSSGRQGFGRQNQQHLHILQSSYPGYGSVTHRSNFNTSTSASTTLMVQPYDLHNRLQSGSQAQLSSTTFQPESVPWQQSSAHPTLHEHKISASSKVEFVDKPALIAPSLKSTGALQADPNILAVPTFPSISINTKGAPKKYSVGQKKPLEASASSPPQPSKKPKVSVAFSDQSIDQLNDVTAVSGVNLREEEEQLFSGPKEECGVSEATRRVVQEEEERLLLQRIPLQKKLAKIMAKSGITRISNDVEHCLSLCVEERLRGLIASLIKSSKQRADVERARHHVLITSDVRHQIFLMNQKVREEWERTQATSDNIQTQNEVTGDAGLDGDKSKGYTKLIKYAKEEDDKTRATAANVAARAAAGGDDMLSKWQLMAAQARQKRESVESLEPSDTGNISRDRHEMDKLGPSAPTPGGEHRGRHPTGPDLETASTISIADVISVLEREPQMARSTLIYRLYNKIRGSDTAGG